jgi:hypothetical protein
VISKRFWIETVISRILFWTKIGEPPAYYFSVDIAHQVEELVAILISVSRWDLRNG